MLSPYITSRIDATRHKRSFAASHHEPDDVLNGTRLHFDAGTELIGTNATAAMQSRSPVFAFRSFSPAAQKQSICSTRASSLSTLSSYIGEDIGVVLTMIRVQFLGVTEQNGHCVYMVQVDSGTEQLVIAKRYSEFRALRQLLFTMLHQGQHCGNGPCKHLHQLTQVTFPHRKWQWTKGSELILAQERLGALQRFVEAILHVYRMAPKRQLRRCSNMRCLAMEEIGRFLGIDIPAFDDVLAGPLLSPLPLRA